MCILTAHANNAAVSCIKCVCTTVIVLVATAITLRGFEDCGHSMTPVFLLEGHFPFCFSTFCEKRKTPYTWPGAKISGIKHFCKNILTTGSRLLVENQVCCILNLDIKLTKIADPERKFAMFLHVLSIS